MPRPMAGAAGLLGEQRAGAEGLGQPPGLGGLAAAFDALEGDERHRALDSSSRR